jgi:hypothetical protein
MRRNGLFSRLSASVKTAVDKSRSGSDVDAQVNAQYEIMLQMAKTGQVTVPAIYRGSLVPVYAATLTESQLLESSSLILEQLNADGRRAVAEEVRTEIIVRIRDIKIHALEADGRVNPLDAASIQLAASALRQRARTHVLSAKMAGAKSVTDMLNDVELVLIGEASVANRGSIEKWQRAIQASIWAVAELRLQQLVK